MQVLPRPTGLPVLDVVGPVDVTLVVTIAGLFLRVATLDVQSFPVVPVLWYDTCVPRNGI